MKINEKRIRGTLLVCVVLYFSYLAYVMSTEENPKGSLSGEEIDFIHNKLEPILVKSNLCASVGKCSGHDYLFCMAHGSGYALTCDVYGITDDKVIKELFAAFMNSGLRVSSITFWQSKYHKTSLFEKPLMKYVDHTDGT
jgi:hypothetical protein